MFLLLNRTLKADVISRLNSAESHKLGVLLALLQAMYSLTLGKSDGLTLQQHSFSLKGGNISPGSFSTWKIQHLLISSMLNRKDLMFNSQLCFAQRPTHSSPSHGH